MAPTYRMTAQISGTRNGQDWPRPGELVDLPETEAADYLAAGLIAEPAKAEETATARTPETATTGGKRAISRRGKAKAPEIEPAEPDGETEPAEPDGDAGADSGS